MVTISLNRLHTTLTVRRKKLAELLSDKSLSTKRKYQLEGAIHEIDFVCMILQQKHEPHMHRG